MKTKILILMTAAFCFSSLAFSQTNKGNWIVSGNSSLLITNTTQERGTGSTTVIFSPSVGYFFMDGIAIGVDANLISSGGSSLFSILPTAAYYFKTAGALKPFVQVGLGYSSSKSHNTSHGGLAVGAGAGALYLLNERVGINLGLQYLRNDYDGTVSNTLGGLLGFSIFF